jgi:hypothetical protein
MQKYNHNNEITISQKTRMLCKPKKIKENRLQLIFALYLFPTILKPILIGFLMLVIPILQNLISSECLLIFLG